MYIMPNPQYGAPTPSILPFFIIRNVQFYCQYTVSIVVSIHFLAQMDRCIQGQYGDLLMTKNSKKIAQPSTKHQFLKHLWFTSDKDLLKFIEH